jgi:lipopolysaccharide export LptBFGC system permease protein LptF
MKEDKEILVFMTSGKSIITIFKPFLLLAVIAVGIVLSIQSYVSPRSQCYFNSLQERIQNKISMSIIKPQVFNVIKSSVIYIGEKTEDSVKDIFISYCPTEKPGSRIITAKVGKYVIENNKLFINLHEGYQQELDKNNSVISILKFKNFSYDVTSFVKRYSKKVNKPHGKTQTELLRDIKNIKDNSIKKECISEFHGRITLPFISIINSLIIALFMVSSISCREKNTLALKSFAYGLSCQILLMTSINASVKYISLIFINYSLIFAAFITLLIILIKDRISK